MILAPWCLILIFMSNKSQIILGIDPGFAITGFGLIRKQGNDLQLIDYGCIKTSAKHDFSWRLEFLHQQLKKIIKKHQPDLIAVEELFFCKNVKTALKVGQARGVVLLTAILSSLPLCEFTPLQIKQAVACYGRADKKQIQQMVKLILKLNQAPQPDDAADALAVAICAAHSHKLKNCYESL